MFVYYDCVVTTAGVHRGNNKGDKVKRCSPAQQVQKSWLLKRTRTSHPSALTSLSSSGCIVGEKTRSVECFAATWEGAWLQAGRSQRMSSFLLHPSGSLGFKSTSTRITKPKPKRFPQFYLFYFGTRNEATFYIVINTSTQKHWCADAEASLQTILVEYHKRAENYFLFRIVYVPIFDTSTRGQCIVVLSFFPRKIKFTI